MSTVSAATFHLFVGADVAKKSAVVGWLTADEPARIPTITVPQTPEGRHQLHTTLLAIENNPAAIHVTLEASGNYHEQLAQFLHEQRFAVSVINPLQIKRFGEVFLQRDKNDAIDAWTLARYGLQMRPRLWSPPPDIYYELTHRIAQRSALVKMKAELYNRDQALKVSGRVSQQTEARTKELLGVLRRQIDMIEREYQAVLREDPLWADTARRIMSIPGVGISTATWLIALTRNFTTCESPKQLAAFIGLVPHRRQSGDSLDTYTRVGYVGHDDIRQHLYIATMSALRYNAIIRNFYDGVKARRKSHKLACVAATHKMVHIIWAVARKGEVFNPTYGIKPLTQATSTTAENAPQSNSKKLSNRKGKPHG
jgi:transposase